MIIRKRGASKKILNLGLQLPCYATAPIQLGYRLWSPSKEEINMRYWKTLNWPIAKCLDRLLTVTISCYHIDGWMEWNWSLSHSVSFFVMVFTESSCIRCSRFILLTKCQMHFALEHIFLNFVCRDVVVNTTFTISTEGQSTSAHSTVTSVQMQTSGIARNGTFTPILCGLFSDQYHIKTKKLHILIRFQ